MHYQLFRPDEKPAEMVHVPGFNGTYRYIPGLNRIGIEAGDFWMDKYEVSNKQYKSFVDAGGYVDPTYWYNPFVDGDDTLDWEAALGQFKDKTGWSGHANWEMGIYPEGEAEIPVTGISWYEASAYAAFAKKNLPTIFHWIYLSDPWATPEIVKFGNFDQRGPSKGGVYNSMTKHGVYDMPGNVSEWILNSAGNRKFIIGGNWQEPNYQYNARVPISPMIRSELIGFRCMRYIDDTLQQKLSRTFEWTDRDFDSAVPVSDEEFSIIEDLFKYEKGNLNSRILSRTEEAEWAREIITVDVPYDEDLPMKMLIFFPRHFKAPYQTIIYVPSANALNRYSTEYMKVGPIFEFILESGRAVIWPVYYATYGRGEIKERDDIHSLRQALIYRVIDFQLVCDYINTRSVFDREKIAYYTYSWGGCLAPYILAIEDRVKLGILPLFGVQSSGEYRETDAINYLPRVKIPMLLMDGRYDAVYTLDQ